MDLRVIITMAGTEEVVEEEENKEEEGGGELGGEGGGGGGGGGGGEDHNYNAVFRSDAAELYSWVKAIVSFQ